MKLPKIFQPQNYIVQINIYSVRRAIRNIIRQEFDIEIPVSDIKIQENSLLIIKNHRFLRTDKHFHFADSKDRDYAIFTYLEIVKDCVKNSKELRKILGVKFVDYK